ncbi:MAG: hypothetical protein FJ224_09015 [Lentisphaerae bacterium]|nr:hypothetical protein [Lentisphaerota bacterium]
MQSIINHLMQLQELALVRDEQKISLGGARTAELDAAISAMKANLPKNIAALFDRLHSKHPTVVTPMAEGVCPMCGMKLPISLVQAVRMERDIHTCPTCSRILYPADSAPRWVGAKPRRSEPRKVGIARFSAQSLMIPGISAATKEEAIAELAATMEKTGFVNRADKLIESALRREGIISTAVDHGIAFPHVRGVEGGGLTLALATSAKGIKWDGPKGKLTRIVFFLTIPTAASAFYLKLLAGLTETFMTTEPRSAILEEKTQEGMWKALQKLTRHTIK